MLDRLRKSRCDLAKEVLIFLATSPTSELSCTPIATLLEPRLNSGDLQAIGLDSDGRLYWVPPQAWRRMVLDVHPLQRDLKITACLSALYTGKVGIPLNGFAVAPEYHAYLSESDFSGVFGLTAEVMQNPQLHPEYLKQYAREIEVRQAAECGDKLEAATKQVSPNRQEQVDAWMKGYAKGFVDCGKKIKREDTIKVCAEVCSCTYVIAERAYEALPYPELRHPPRVPKTSQ